MLKRVHQVHLAMWPSHSVYGAPVVFADPAKYAGKTVPVARELVSWPDVAQTLSEVTGIPVKCVC